MKRRTLNALMIITGLNHIEFVPTESKEDMTTLPTIHLNGTGAQNLFSEYYAALKSIREASNTLVNATCNQRDFYPQGDGAWEKARAERSEMFLHLEMVEQYLSAWAEHANNHIKD